MQAPAGGMASSTCPAHAEALQPRSARRVGNFKWSAQACVWVGLPHAPRVLTTTAFQHRVCRLHALLLQCVNARLTCQRR